MTQRQLFHALLILFSIFIYIDGLRLFIEVLPKLAPSFAESLYDFSKEGGWPLPSASYIFPPLLPSLSTLGLASLVLYKASDLATWLFPESTNSPLIIQLQPEEWLRWAITLIGIFLLGWLTIPSLLSIIFHPLVMNFYPELAKKKPDMAFIQAWYWEFFIGNVGRFLLQGSFGLVCLLFAPRLAAWIIRIQKYPKPSQSQ